MSWSGATPLLVAGAFFGITIWLASKQKVDEKELSKPLKPGQFLLGALALLLWIGASMVVGITYKGFTITVIPPQSALVDKQTEEIAEWFDGGDSLWRWDERFRSSHVVSYASQVFNIKAKASPISENPKVRNFHFTISVGAFGTPELLEQFLGEGYDSPQEFIDYWLYEFNEQLSKEIAGLSNPKSDKQQAQFRLLIEGFLGPQFQDAGLRFLGATFDIPLRDEEPKKES